MMDILTFFIDILLKPPQPFTGLFFLTHCTYLLPLVSFPNGTDYSFISFNRLQVKQNLFNLCKSPPYTCIFCTGMCSPYATVREYTLTLNSSQVGWCSRVLRITKNMCPDLKHYRRG